MNANAAKANEIVEVSKALFFALMEEVPNPLINITDYLMSGDPGHIRYHTKKNKELKIKFSKYDRHEVMATLMMEAFNP